MAFEWINTLPEGDSSLDRMAVTAIECGFDSVVIRNTHDVDSRGIDTDRDLDVFHGVEIDVGDVDRMHGLADKYHGRRDVVCVSGGDESINRAAVKSRYIDVLCDPLRNGYSSFPYILAEEAAENDVVLEVNLSRITRGSGGDRVQSIRKIHYLQKLIRKYGNGFVISCDPLNHLEMNAVRDIRALCGVLGFSEEEIDMGLDRYPRDVIDNDVNKDRGEDV